MTQDWTFPLATNLISAMIFFFLGILSKNFLDIVRKKNPVHYFWNEGLKSSINIIIPSLSKNYDEFSLHTGHSDLKAFAITSSLLSSFHNNADEIKMIEARYVLDRLDENIVLIGGPITNEITGEIMSNFKIPFSFEGHVLIDNYNNKKYEPKLDENGKILEDYAFILKTKNPYNNKNTLIIIAGCYGYGTYSGAKALTDYDILRKIKRNGTFKSIGLIVKSHIINGIPQRPFLIDSFKLE